MIEAVNLSGFSIKFLGTVKAISDLSGQLKKYLIASA
jgi:hypothetical protein